MKIIKQKLRYLHDNIFSVLDEIEAEPNPVFKKDLEEYARDQSEIFATFVDRIM